MTISQMHFATFPKIPRLKREVIVTEKIDGTNAQILIRIAGADELGLEFGFDTQIEVDGVQCYIRAGSRNRWIQQSGKEDNYGFGRWVYQHAHELAKLGIGQHFGEWWGQGIQRGYGLLEKRFSLFNVHRWGDASADNPNTSRPACCHVVPVLGRDDDFIEVDRALFDLKQFGSVAAPGFMNPEGVIVFHRASNTLFKQTLERDSEPKGFVIRDIQAHFEDPQV